MTYNSTIIPKEKECKCGCGKKGFIYAKGMLHLCYLKQFPRKPIAKFSKKRESELEGVQGESFKNVSADLDTVFSLIIRTRYASVNGNVRCFTCSTVKHYKEMDCSHYISRSHLGTRWLTENAECMCKFCNNLHNEDTEPFRLAMEKQHKGITEFLEEQKHATHKFTLSDLIELRTEYNSRLNTIMLKFNK